MVGEETNSLAADMVAIVSVNGMEWMDMMMGLDVQDTQNGSSAETAPKIEKLESCLLFGKGRDKTFVL